MNKSPAPPYDPICIQAMEYILDNGDATATEMKEYATWSPLNNRMKKLIDDGLVEYYLPDKGRKTVHYILTPKGRTFVKAVRLSHQIYYGKLDIEDVKLEEVLEELGRSVSE